MLFQRKATRFLAACSKMQWDTWWEMTMINDTYWLPVPVPVPAGCCKKSCKETQTSNNQHLCFMRWNHTTSCAVHCGRHFIAISYDPAQPWTTKHRKLTMKVWGCRMLVDTLAGKDNLHKTRLWRQRLSANLQYCALNTKWLSGRLEQLKIEESLPCGTRST